MSLEHLKEPWPGRRRHVARYTVELGNWEWLKPNEELGTLHYIYMRDVCDLLTHNKIQTVELHDIAWKGKHHHPHNTGEHCYCCKETPALRYVHALEDFIGARISSISTSPERDDTILVEDPFNS